MKRPIGRGRRPLTKAQLLPFPGEQVRRLQLKHHIALAAIRDGYGNVEQLATLINVVHLAFLLSQSTVGSTATDTMSMCRQAEQALDRCVARAASGEPIALADDERLVLEPLLLMHDMQLATSPTHRYVDAWTTLQGLGPDCSPIPTDM